MRLHSRTELREELEHAHWLRRTAARHPHLEAQLLDAVLLSQQPRDSSANASRPPRSGSTLIPTDFLVNSRTSSQSSGS